jgi:hypothetical protein
VVWRTISPGAARIRKLPSAERFHSQAVEFKGKFDGLKIPRWKQRAGSIPAPGTNSWYQTDASRRKIPSSR